MLQLQVMRYDFRKIQEAIDVSGKTLRQIEELSGLHYSTISRALRTGRAHQSTALKLTNAFCISMKDIQVRNGNGRKSA